MSDELRCPSRIHGVVTSQESSGLLEVKCHSKRCEAGNGVVVLHLFDLETRSLIQTRRFRDPVSRTKRED